MARIAVMGSVAVDEVVLVEAGVREGAHLEGTWRGRRLGGGAANTGAALAHAGHTVTVVSAIGGDEAGDWILAELRALGLDVGAVVRLPGASTRSFVLVDGRGERTVVNVGRAMETDPPARLLDLEADWVYVRSRAGGLGQPLAVRARTSRIIAHIPPLGDGERPAHVLIGSTSDLGPEILADPLAAGRRIAGPRLDWVVITRGADGAAAFGADGVVTRPAAAVRPVDTTGAGDAFAAGLAHALALGAPMAAALETANAWGAESTLYESSALPRSARVFAGAKGCYGWGGDHERQDPR